MILAGRRGSRVAALAAGLVASAACAGPASAPPGVGERVYPVTPGPSETVVAPHAPPAVEPPPIEPGHAPAPGRYHQPVDVLHYDLEVGVSDTADWIAGRADVRVTPTGPLDAPFILDLTGLAVDEVQVDGRPVDAGYAPGRLSVPLGKTRPGDTITVTVRYRGVPDDGLVIGHNVHGRPTVFADNWPDRARFWFPSVDHPSDKATVRFTVHAPGTWRVVANGVLAEGSPRPAEPGAPGPLASGPRSTWIWSTEVPIPTYTMVIGAADLVVGDVGTAACAPREAPRAVGPDGCVPISTWLFPGDSAAGAPSFRRAARMVDHFTGLFGPFPYEKLAHVQSSTRFGGMENASAVFYAEAPLAAGRDIEGTVSHETVHQWFGDSATEGDWHHLWLSEGFATYFGHQFFEAVDGEDRFRALMEADRREYMASDVVDRPVVDPDETNLFALLNANNYQKGGWVLHMLRGLVGDDAFFRGVSAYYRAHALGTALTGDFEAAMEEASGLELGWFFQQWLREPGYPVFQVETRWDARTDTASVTVRQVQPAPWPVFRVPTEIELDTPDGPVRRAVEIDRRTQTFRIAAPAEPTGATVDPDGWVLHRGVEQGSGGGGRRP